LGSKVVAQNLRIRKPYFLILIVLIPILLTNIGITPQFYGTPNSILLNPPDSINNTYYIHDSEASSVKWLRSYRDININVYTDYASFGRLVSVASIPREDIKTITTIPHNGYTYLSYYNVKQNKLAFWRYADVWSKLDIKNFQNILNQNLIYDDGGSEILL